MSKSETADGYIGTIVQSGRFRVVRCKDDIQWIVQKDARAHGAGAKKRPWYGVAYILNKRFLPIVIERPSLGIPPVDIGNLVAGLPE